MSTQYDLPRPAHLSRTMDNTHLRIATKPASSHSLRSTQRSSRRVPVESTSLPQTSWLSDVAEFTTSPLSHNHLGVSLPGNESLLSSGSISDTGSPLGLSPRSRSRDIFPPSPIISPQASGSGSFSRHSPVPPARMLRTSRSFTATSPLKSSAFSDRDASGHLDFKRLMSKPAKQTASSMVSLPSDSERSASASSSRFATSRRPSESLPSSPPLWSANPSHERLPLHGLRPSSAPRQSQGPSPERRAGTSDGHPPKPARNVLRRRPSSRSNPGTPTAHHFQIPSDQSLPPPRTTPSKHQTRSERHTVSLSARPTTSPSSNRAATLPRKLSLSNASRSQHHPAGLTPAGAVALAYKQQEQRREELAETASFNDAYNPSANAAALPMRNVDVDVPGDEAEEEGGEPYYTVFGSSSGRLVAVGSPIDDDWHVGGWETRVTAGAGAKPAPVGSKSLSRKVSGSFKKVAESMKRDKEVRDPVARTKELDDWRPYDGSRSVSGRDSPSPFKVSRKPLPLDTKFEGRNSPRASPVPKGSPPPQGSPSPQEDGRSSRASKSKAKERTEELSPGGMWSKLMKRISSSGGLREKYNHSDEPPPPVPALPQNIPKAPATRTTMEIPHTENGEVSENGVLLRRFMQSRASLSGVRPSITSPKASSPSSSRPSTGTAGRPSTGNTTKSRGSLGQRPSTTTRSSSPVSSEMASSGFFNHNRTPSTRSSISSLGEVVPPMPKNLGRYIVPPGELSRMTKTSESNLQTPPSKRYRKTSRSQSAPVDERLPHRSADDSILPSLPLPPRRATHEGSSPMSSSFSPEDTAQPAGGSRPPPLAEFGMKEPPPRPKRSSRRAAPPNVEVPPRSQSMSATMPRSPATPRAPPAVRVDVDLARRPSTGALSYASTARQVSATSSDSPSSGASHSASPSSAASQKRSPLLFRELESPRQKLSEKEKAAKWEDLLERSARAGGTLHISDSGLLSEHPDIEESSVHGYEL
ncbi:hypothetical protein BV20DRAFT_996303 [Pilatotrama ljubarskyi]|nr:hypothetical protein BV20DRAFT_996303 [Pilatotrama ljubarskyi]